MIIVIFINKGNEVLKSLKCAVFCCFCFNVEIKSVIINYHTKICTIFKMKSILQCYRLSKMDKKLKHYEHQKLLNKERNKREKPVFKKAVPKYKILEEKIAYLESSYETINAEEVKLFTDLPLTDETLRGLQFNKYEKPTKIQKESIGKYLIGGRGYQ